MQYVFNWLEINLYVSLCCSTRVHRLLGWQWGGFGKESAASHCVCCLWYPLTTFQVKSLFLQKKRRKKKSFPTLLSLWFDFLALTFWPLVKLVCWGFLILSSVLTQGSFLQWHLCHKRIVDLSTRRVRALSIYLTSFVFVKGSNKVYRLIDDCD